MADRDYSPYQQKVISRYYQNRDQLDDQRLSEIVTNLFLAKTDKQRNKLWETAEEIMTRLEVPGGRIKHILNQRDPAVLAEVVQDLQSGKLKKK
ncbi:MAG: hypothetical protein KDA80_02840 [Planctomycetaceae bacterium]|nr:hypothetical protein [Planctomycetaceae bacterium]